MTRQEQCEYVATCRLYQGNVCPDSFDNCDIRILRKKLDGLVIEADNFIDRQEARIKKIRGRQL